MELNLVKILADKLLDEHGLIEKGWRFSFDRAKRRAGSCKFSKKEITIAKAYAEQQERMEIKNTMFSYILLLQKE